MTSHVYKRATNYAMHNMYTLVYDEKVNDVSIIYFLNTIVSVCGNTVCLSQQSLSWATYRKPKRYQYSTMQSLKYYIKCYSSEKFKQILMLCTNSALYTHSCLAGNLPDTKGHAKCKLSHMVYSIVRLNTSHVNYAWFYSPCNKG